MSKAISFSYFIENHDTLCKVTVIFGSFEIGSNSCIIDTWGHERSQK